MVKAENESTVFAMTIQTPCHAGVSMTSLGFLFLQECFHQIYGQSARIIRLKHTSTHLPTRRHLNTDFASILRQNTAPGDA